jgi:hypothetical protein
MSDQAQLAAQIRFALEQLSERNAQHEWEHLCRHLTRERICANVLPATGPVQAGGDQGRDFETFRSFLARNPLHGRAFVGLISERPLAFACTLEKRPTPKIKRDVTTITSSGTPVEGIYVFCTCDLPVAKRHELQEWARETHSVSLEILDGAAVAELLCDRDLFWLAERYLQLPSGLLPVMPSGEEKDWHARTLAKWRRETRPAQTFADFTEIRAAARFALGPFGYDDDGRPVNRYERPELPFWIERLDEIADHQVAMDSLRRRAFYEASVLRLRGLGSLVGQEERLRLYFADIPQLQDAVDLEDAEVLLNYVLPANLSEQVGLEESEVESWFWALEHRLDERLREAEKNSMVNERCALLEVRGHTALLRRLTEGVISGTEALKYWAELAKLATHAPLFPLERFADRLTEYARYVGAHPDYEPLTEAVDALVAERFGSFKAAEKCLQRAQAFRAAGDLPRAMAQIHRAKIDWFAEETLGRALTALRWLSRAYLEQGLFFAAKYYALAAAYVALHAQDLRLKPLVARSLEQASSCDYALGAWHGFLELAEAGAVFYPHFAHDPEADFNNPGGVLQHLVFHLGLLPVATKLLHPDLEPFAHERCVGIAERLGLANVLKDVQASAEETWVEQGPQGLWDTMEEQLAGPPWSDAGPVRYAQWRAHGVTWNAQWANDYETTLAAEDFLASLQILLSDLAGYDLCLMRSTVNISLRLARDDGDVTVPDGPGYSGFDTRFEPSNAERLPTVVLPPYRQFREGGLSRQDLLAGAVSVVSSLLAEVSLLPTERFHSILNERFTQGLQNKLFIGAPYGECLREFVPRDVFDDSGRAARGSLATVRNFASRLPETLPWFDGPGPGYDPEEAREQLQNRYDGFYRPVARTLQRLSKDPEFQATVARLRADGWKDWHILSAVFHVTMNYRLDQRRLILLTPEAELAFSRQLMSQPEPADALTVPLQEYGEENLRQQLTVCLGAFARSYGLEMHQLTPDFESLEHFLAHRYNFWADDVEHNDPFEP